MTLYGNDYIILDELTCSLFSEQYRKWNKVEANNFVFFGKGKTGGSMKPHTMLKLNGKKEVEHLC